MSLIRSGSNPEGYYVWSDGKLLHWYRGTKFLSVPSAAFCAFVRGYLRNLEYEPYTLRGFRIEEHYVLPNGRIATQKQTTASIKARDDGGFRYILTYKSRRIAVM